MRSAHRCLDDCPGAGDRRNLGQADVGLVVGLGCTADVDADSAVSVFRPDRAGQRHHQPRQRSQGLRRAGHRRGDQHSDHQILGGVVEHLAPGRHVQSDGKTGHACRNVAAAAVHRTGAPSRHLARHPAPGHRATEANDEFRIIQRFSGDGQARALRLVGLRHLRVCAGNQCAGTCFCASALPATRGAPSAPGEHAVNPLRKKRLLIIVAILAGVGIAVSLALSALKENINLFYTPTQIASGEAPRDTRIRAGGMVEKGSLQRSADSLDVTFVVTDFNKSVTITYRGILPDLFREGQGIVALGRLNGDGVRPPRIGRVLCTGHVSSETGVTDDSRTRPSGHDFGAVLRACSGRGATDGRLAWGPAVDEPRAAGRVGAVRFSARVAVVLQVQRRMGRARGLAVAVGLDTGRLDLCGVDLFTATAAGHARPRAGGDGHDQRRLSAVSDSHVQPVQPHPAAVAFAFAIAALLGGRLDAAWARWSRPWTIVAWAFLGVGITLGSCWAYYELGWGGWWFWDPLDRASGHRRVFIEPAGHVPRALGGTDFGACVCLRSSPWRVHPDLPADGGGRFADPVCRARAGGEKPRRLWPVVAGDPAAGQQPGAGGGGVDDSARHAVSAGAGRLERGEDVRRSALLQRDVRAAHGRADGCHGRGRAGALERHAGQVAAEHACPCVGGQRGAGGDR
nr:cytochrome c biogenesis factor N, mitochondrial [Tanacetum cinerariifolium]